MIREQRRRKQAIGNARASEQPSWCDEGAEATYDCVICGAKKAFGINSSFTYESWVESYVEDAYRYNITLPDRVTACEEHKPDLAAALLRLKIQ